ncbi:MAG TPA: endolytic transglycosylase MltG [Ideonella sp.]|nr:endolytic transglycosylase MltG [Ideonella sp.]
MKLLIRIVKLIALAGLLGIVLAGGGALWWLYQPLSLRTPTVEASVEPGTTSRDIALLWVQAGVDTPGILLYEWFRWSGQARRIRAGSYEIERGITPRGLLDKMVRGDETLETVRFIEGWTFRQVREALARAPHLKPATAQMSEAQIAAALGAEVPYVEGAVFPDTYAYSRGVSDLTVLKRAHAAMRAKLAAAWATRVPGLPLDNPQQLLTLASVVEKETGSAADRGLIAGVFVNRLRAGMPLQSDPTVIFGLGRQFDGNLRRSHLQDDNPWNTYTRRGLPPTPIAMPGLASLRAATQPEPTRALYFVARGDGHSVFSETLADHNRAVNQYQRGQR